MVGLQQGKGSGVGKRVFWGQGGSCVCPLSSSSDLMLTIGDDNGQLALCMMETDESAAGDWLWVAFGEGGDVNQLPPP